MSGATEQPGTPAADEEVQAGATNAFQAGFDSDDDEAPTETPAPAPSPAEPAPTPAPSPEPKYVQITEDDWNSIRTRAAKVDEIEATWSKKLDTAFGKVGGIERKLAELQTATPQGEALQLDEADFADLKDQYPEIGELTLKAMNKALSRIKGTAGVDSEALNKQLESKLSEATAAIRRELEEERLEDVLPNWKQEVNTPAFDAWITAQKGWDTRLKDAAFVRANLADPQSPLSKWVAANPDEPVSLYLSTKTSGAARMLRAYDASRKSASAPPPTQPPAPPQAQLTVRQRQLAAAVPPRSDSASPRSSTGKSAFQEGFEEDD